MKTVIFVLSIMFLVTGCGSNKKEAEKSDSTPKAQIASEQLLDKGFEYLTKGDITNAIRNFDAAIRQNPTDPKGYLILGQTYLRLKNYESAIGTLGVAAKVDPNNGHVYYLLSLANNFAGDKEKAIEAIDKSIGIYQQQQDEENFKRALALLQVIKNTPKQE